MGMGMGLMRKALFIATGGLSGLVFKDNSKKEPELKTAEKQVRPRKQTKVARPKARKARRPKPRADRKSTVAQTVGSGNGTTDELERLANLHRRGALTDEEFAAAKAKTLETSLTPHASGSNTSTFPAIEANVAAARDLADSAVHDRGASVAGFSSD